MTDAKRSNPTKRINDLSSLLFGEPEDVQEDELEDVLRASGINEEDSRNRLYDRLRREAQPYWMAQKELPTRLKKALEEFRPDTAPIRSEKELAKRAGSGVTRILNAAKSALGPLPAGELTFSAAFRNAKEEISAADQATIDRLQKELLESIQSEDDDHK